MDFRSHSVDEMHKANQVALSKTARHRNCISIPGLEITQMTPLADFEYDDTQAVDTNATIAVVAVPTGFVNNSLKQTESTDVQAQQ